MEKELQRKEQELMQVTRKQTDLEMRVMQINLNETETRSENERLQKVTRGRRTGSKDLCDHLGESSVGTRVARDQSIAARVEELHLPTANANEERETRSSEVSDYLSLSATAIARIFRHTLNLTENLAIEHETLVKELTQLK